MGGRLQPSLFGAIMEGSVFAFIGQDDFYNPVLWTMREELFGSLLILCLGWFLWRCPRRAGLILLLAGATVTQWVDPRLLAFIAGLALSWLHTRGVPPVGPWLAAACLAVGLWLFGYLEPRGVYRPLAFLADGSAWRRDRIWLHTISGLLLILGLLASEPAGRLLTSAFARLLGRLSFPVYLFHFPLLCSLSCWLFLAARRSLTYDVALLVAALGTVPALLVVSYGFARIDEMWLTQVNRVTRRVIPVPTT